MHERPEFEPPVERSIREAIERGDFADLPGTGKPIPGAGTRDDALWWVRSWLERQRHADALHDARMLLERRLGDLWPLPSESEVVARVAEINASLPEGLVPLDVADVLDTWRAMAAARRQSTR